MAEHANTDSHAYIKDIVQQVRSGKKNKQEAFSELKSILQTNKSASALDTSDVSNPALSEAERSALINRIAEQRRNENQDPANESVEDSTILSSTNTTVSGVPREAWTPMEYKPQYSGSSFQPRENPSMDVRTQRIAQAESVIRAEMFKECTFKPKIKKLPDNYNSSQDHATTTPFYERVTKWQKEKEIESVRRKELVDESMTVDCTFHPRINRNSDRAVREQRGDDVNESATERLYRSNETSQYQRSKFIEEELRKEKIEEDATCTFKPTLITAKKKFAFVRAKFDQPQTKDRTSQFGMVMDENEKECTFTPKVKGVRSNMPSAKMYVDTNVIERLTRPVTAPTGVNDSTRFDAVGDGSVMDVASFMGSLASGRPSTTTPGGDRRSSSTPRERTAEKSVLTEEERAARVKNFREFLGRQNQTKVRKDNKLKEVEEGITPKFQPKLCRKSLEMSNNSYTGDFVSRVERDVNRRADQAMKKQNFVEPAASFKPKINQRSTKMSSRSVAEMSKGDMLRKSANYRMMKLKTEQEAMTDYTFQPMISKRAQSAGRGKIKLSTDPSAVVELHRQTQRQREEERVRREQARIEAELAECTFAPKTKKCPTYVSNIAKSMEIVRNARATEAAHKPGKPDWR